MKINILSWIIICIFLFVFIVGVVTGHTIWGIL
jgi:hypothetical protein